PPGGAGFRVHGPFLRLRDRPGSVPGSQRGGGGAAGWWPLAAGAGSDVGGRHGRPRPAPPRLSSNRHPRGEPLGRGPVPPRRDRCGRVVGAGKAVAGGAGPGRQGLRGGWKPINGRPGVAGSASFRRPEGYVPGPLLQGRAAVLVQDLLLVAGADGPAGLLCAQGPPAAGPTVVVAESAAALELIGRQREVPFQDLDGLLAGDAGG